MNGLLIIVLIILAAFAIHGYAKGFLRIVFSLISLILLIGLVSWATPYVSSYLKENTEIYQVLTEKCSEAVKDATMEKWEQEKIEEEPSFEDVQLPALLKKQFLEQTGETVNQLAENNGWYQRAGEYLADWIVKGISFFAAFLLMSILLRFVLGLLDIVAKIPIIKGINRLLGILAGLLQGLLMVWLLMFLISLGGASTWGKMLLGSIQESPFLTFLYDYNGIILFVTMMFQ